MSIEPRSKDAEGNLPAAAGGSSQTSAELNNLDNSPVQDAEARTAVVTIQAKSKDFKENLTPSFQELEYPNTTLATTSSKVEELKSQIEAESKRSIAQSEANSEEKLSLAKSD